MLVRSLMKRTWQAVSLFAIVLSTSTVSGADWTEFRGPTGQGHWAGSLPSVWSKTKNVRWRKEIPGSGWSSPVVYQGVIYLTTSVPKQGNREGDQSLQTLCLDAESGKLLWQREVFFQEGAAAPKIHAKNSHASPTPLIYDDKIYVHFGHQGTACLKLDGSIVWKNNRLRYHPVHGNGGTPIIVDNLLVFSCDGGEERFVVALDRATGEVVWKVDREGQSGQMFSFSTPLLITVNGNKQIVSPGSNSVSAYEPRTGKQIWKVRYDGYSVIPRPVFAHGLVYICTGYGTPSLLAIRPDGAGDVTDTHVVWTMKKAVPHTPSLLIVGDELYMVADRTEVATCLDAKTGKIHWQERIGGAYSSSPLYAGGKVYFQSEQGATTVVKASKKFEVVSKNDLAERSLASFAVADGSLLIRTERNLYRIEEK